MKGVGKRREERLAQREREVLIDQIIRLMRERKSSKISKKVEKKVKTITRKRKKSGN